MSVEYVVSVLREHSIPARETAEGHVEGLVSFSRRTDRGITYGTEWERVPTSSKRDLFGWLGY